MAITDYTKAIEIDPKDAPAYGLKAWLLATCPYKKFRNGKEAVRLATKACELSGWSRMKHINTLAAAYAERGNFPEAVKWQKKTLEDKKYARTQGKEAQERLKLYEQGRPYREKVKE